MAPHNPPHAEPSDPHIPVHPFDLYPSVRFPPNGRPTAPRKQKSMCLVLPHPREVEMFDMRNLIYYGTTTKDDIFVDKSLSSCVGQFSSRISSR